MTTDDKYKSSDDALDSELAYELPDLERPASASPTEEELDEQLPVSGRLGGRDPYIALRHRDYRLYAIGGLVAAIGGQMQGVAVGWELYERTNSPLALGLVGLVQALPVILLALPAGHVADRFDRKQIVILTQVAMMLASAGLAALSYFHGPLSLIYGCLLLAGVARAFDGPARGAMLPQLVPMSVLSNAVTWNSSRWQIASMVGPALGGLAIAVLHSAAIVYVVNALCVGALIGFMARVNLRAVKRSTEAASLQTLLAGIRFVRGNKLILATITLDMFAVLLGGADMLLPVFARDILQVGPSGLGWLRAAPAIGALLMALTLAYLPPLRRAGKALLWSVAGFGVATIVFGLSKNFWLSLFMLFLTGAFDNISVTIRHTLVQLLTPDYMRGRVSAVNSVFIGTSNELGGYESGQVAALFGPIFAVVSGGIGTVLVVLAVGKIWPQVKELDTLLGAAEEQSPKQVKEEKALEYAT